MGLIFPDRGEPERQMGKRRPMSAETLAWIRGAKRRGCAGCGEPAEACTCPLYLTPYAIAFLERAAANCATDRVRIDLLTAHRSLVERNASLSHLPSTDLMG